MSRLGRKKFIVDETGSISVLVIGLFLLLLSVALILTDFSSIYLAKRSLTLASEAAVQRGLKNLDAKSYYSGEYNLTQLAKNVIGSPEKDPGVPIDCGAGLRDSREVLQSWQRSGGASIRENIEFINLADFQCDGFQIYLETSARVRIPIPLPFTKIDSLEIRSHAGGVGERRATNSFYGLKIG